MLFLHRQKLAFLCVPKAASTSIEQALLPYSGISFTAAPALKHMDYLTFLEHIGPLIARGHSLGRADYLVIAVMREPISWAHSWYRYRSREELKDPTASNHANYCGHLSFSEFVRAYCSAEQPAYARVGNQLGMLLDADRRIGVDRIFPYECLLALTHFLSDSVGAPITLADVNRSPPGDLVLEPDAEALLRRKLGRVIELHSRLRPDGLLDEARRRPLRPKRRARTSSPGS